MGMCATSVAIPVVLFAYARPNHLRQTLECLRANCVPFIYAYSDAPLLADKAPAVATVRAMLRAIDWCEVVLHERESNLGLGRSILAGVTEVMSKHEAAIVFEDDLVCMPGTYEYLCAALRQYRGDSRVMSVTGWTQPSVTPRDLEHQPYFDGRAECLVWGTWPRAWQGMDQDAKTLMHLCEEQGIDVFRYGADLPAMAEVERRENIWAVRFLYWHILNRGLCLRPPWSMVEHIGFDAQATNASSPGQWANPPLRPCPPIPEQWPEPEEHADCPALWQHVCGGRPTMHRPSPPLSVSRKMRRGLRRTAVRMTGSTNFGTMTPRDLARLLTPPILVKAGRRAARNVGLRPTASASVPTSRPEWEYIPEGWTHAQTHPEVKGWNVEDVLQTYKEKWPQFLCMVQGTGPLGVGHESALTTSDDINSHNTTMAFAYALALAARHKDRLSMLDWGGGIGHYYLLAQALLPGVDIEYHCKDVPVLADYGATLFADAHFYSDDGCLKRTYDFVLASTSLHYSEDWRTLLHDLAAVSGDCLLVTRLPTALHVPDYVFVQRPYAYGYNTEYLGWCLNRTGFLNQAHLLGLKLVREFVIGERPPVVNAPEPCQYRGFLFRTFSGERTK